MDGCAGRGDESLGLLDRRGDRYRRCGDRRGHEAVHLLGGEDRRGACKEAGGRLGVTGLRIGGERELLVEDDEGGFLALADLRPGLGPLPVRAPDAGTVTEFLGISPERHDVDAAIRFLRSNIDGPHVVAGGAMPGQPEVSRDRAHDLAGDVLVNIEAAGLHGQFSAERCVSASGAARCGWTPDDNWVRMRQLAASENWPAPVGLLTLMQVDPQHFEFLDEGFGHSRVLQRTGAVRERLPVVTHFLRRYLPGFEYGIDLTRGGPLEECRRKGGIFSDHSGLNFAVPPRPPRLRTNWGSWDPWDGPLLHARLDDRWR